MSNLSTKNLLYRALLSLVKTGLYWRQPNTFEYIESTIQQAIKVSKETENYYGLVTACNYLKGQYALHGYWREFLEIEKDIFTIPVINSNLPFKTRLFTGWQIGRAWMGRYAEAEKILKDVYDADIRVGRDEPHRDLLLAIGLQKRINEVSHLFEKQINKHCEIGQEVVYDLTRELGFWGVVAFHNGNLQLACNYLNESKEILQSKNDPVGVEEIPYWFGICCLVKGEWEEAEKSFSEYLLFPQNEFCYFKSGTLIGLGHIKHVQSKLAEIPALFAEAEALAQQHEYNDHLATLRLLQGHLAWQDDFEKTLQFYQKALMYAFRFNRFCLDEILCGDNIPTPYQPLIPFCLQQGDHGRAMLARLKA